MTYASANDPYKIRTKSNNAATHGPARNWYALQAAQIGAAELPVYGRALRVLMESTATVPLTMVVVPIDEPNDATTQTVKVLQTEILPYAVRRIVSLNGGTVLPTGVSIDIITG